MFSMQQRFDSTVLVINVSCDKEEDISSPLRVIWLSYRCCYILGEDVKTFFIHFCLTSKSKIFTK